MATKYYSTALSKRDSMLTYLCLIVVKEVTDELQLSDLVQALIYTKNSLEAEQSSTPWILADAFKKNQNPDKNPHYNRASLNFVTQDHKFKEQWNSLPLRKYLTRPIIDHPTVLF